MTPTDPARAAFEAWAKDCEFYLAPWPGSSVFKYYDNHTHFAWLGYQAAREHARAEMEVRDAEIRRILAIAPDLNLKDYSKGQVERLVRAMQQTYALVSNDPPSLRGDARATLAEPQQGAGEG